MTLLEEMRAFFAARRELTPIHPEPSLPPTPPAGRVGASPCPQKEKPMATPSTTPTPVNPLSFLSALLGVLENPEDALLIEAAGRFINTVAAHNQNHLGATAASTLETIGQSIEAAPGLATALTGGGATGSQTDQQAA